MWIECLIKREGPTHLTIDRFDYTFRNRDDCGGNYVCDVTNDSHAQQMIATGLYRPYTGPTPTASPDPAPDQCANLRNDDTEPIESLLKQGLSYAQIAEKLGRSKSWVAYRVKKLGGQ